MADGPSTQSVEILAKALHRLASDERGAEESDHELPPPSRRARPSPLELNVVPLVDVLFLLMVFFVIGGAGGIIEGVLASRMARGATGAGSGPGGDVPIPSTPIVVEVKAGRQNFSMCTVKFGTVHREATSEARLAAELKQMIILPGLNASTPVVISTDDEVLWDDVARVWNAILVAGFRDVAFQRPSGRPTGRVELGK